MDSYEFIRKVLDMNNLIPCYEEVTQVKSIIDAEKGDTLKTFEKAGKLKLNLKQDKFFA